MRDESSVFTVLVDGETWTETASLENARAKDKVFIVDHSTGTVHFGDGIHGQQPKSSAEVTVSFRQGDGETGNVQVSVASPWPPKPSRYLVDIKDHGFEISTLGSTVERCSGEKRVHYFVGQLLSADDFRDEQQYHIRMRYLHNKVLHGPGIATGFGVSVSSGTASLSVVISPGFAIDEEGHEIILNAPIELPISDKRSPQYVTIEHTEKETDWVISPDGSRKVPSRIEDCSLARLVADPQQSGALTIGRVVRGPAGWDVDRTFQPVKSR
jgi:hypothetical protein